MRTDRTTARHEAGHCFALTLCAPLRESFQPAGAALTKDGGGFVHQSGLDVDRAVEAPDWSSYRNGLFEAVFLERHPEHIEALFRFNLAGFAVNLFAAPHGIADRVSALLSSDGEDVYAALQWLAGMPDCPAVDQFLRATRSDALARAEDFFRTNPAAVAAVEALAAELQKHRRLTWQQIETFLTSPTDGAHPLVDKQTALLEYTTMQQRGIPNHE